MPANTKSLVNAPNVLTFSKQSNIVNLIIHGQCVFLFNTNVECSFTFYTKDKSDGLRVSLSTSEFLVSRLSNSEKYVSQLQKNGGLTTKSGAYYWFSLDSQNQLLQAGIGEARIETSSYKYQFIKDPSGNGIPNNSSNIVSMHSNSWEDNKKFLESLVSIELPDSITALRLLKNPITMSVPLIVKSTNDLSMEDVASTVYLPNALLSPTCQMLYNCVSGEKFTLNTPDFPDFSKAIEYSINTPGLWCNTRLKQKASEFGNNPQPLETYLRITIGQNNGESPGIPYVMEIWPVGHYSPIHNHGGSNAIIRVLHGNINVKLFPYLCNDASGVEPFSEKDFSMGDITWISTNLNQVHQLQNLKSNKEACITIQCYMYDKNDTVHYDYFDYLGDNNQKGMFEPDSDMDYIEFKRLIRKEWEKRPRWKSFNVYHLLNPELEQFR
jgi:hypothetical protein